MTEIPNASDFVTPQNDDAAIDFAKHMRGVAVELLGEPSSKKGTTWRWGSQGSMSVKINSGKWFTHEDSEGGGVLDLIVREKGGDYKMAIAWMREKGFIPPQDHAVYLKAGQRIVDTFAFRKTGAILYRKHRIEPGDDKDRKKSFRFDHPDGAGGWKSGAGDTRIPYLADHIGGGDVLYMAEGEAKAEKLASWGLCATSLKDWRSDFAEYVRGRDVFILPDNDASGEKQAADTAKTVRQSGGNPIIVRLPGLPAKGDILDWAGDLETLEALAADARANPDAPSQDNPPKGRIRPYSLEELLTTQFPPRANLLPPWLPEKGIVMVYAPRGVGKTHFALGVAYAVASGGPFLRWQAVAQRPVLLLDGEMPAVVLQERLAAIAANAEAESPAGNVQLLPYDLFEEGGPDLSTDEGQAELEPFIGNAALIVVDNISTICRGGKENESESWAGIQAWALSQRRKGRTVMFIHHSGKGGDQRGTSKREDVMDTVVKLTRPADYIPTQGARFNVEFTKSRGFTGDDAEAFEAQFADGQWITRAIEDVRAGRILELKSEGLTQRQIAIEVGCGVATVNRTLKGVDHDG